METRKKTLALVGWTQHPNWEPDLKELSEYVKKDKDYVVLSNPIEVEFTMLPEGAVATEKLLKLREIKAEIVDKFSSQLVEITGEIAKCEAIGYEPPSNDTQDPLPDPFAHPSAPSNDSDIPF